MPITSNKITKQTIRVKKAAVLTLTCAVIGFGLTVYVVTNPGIAACAIAHNKQVHSTVQEQLLAEAKTRIQNAFGTPRAQPIVIFFDDPNAFWPLKVNPYGSTHFIGSRTCVMVGSKGQNPDVVAHEFMHAEIADRVGYWRRFTQLPVWFDEGLAMQVDFRPRYNLTKSDEAQAETVKTLVHANEFFVPNDERLTKNYASAKAVVALWVTDIGKTSVYSYLSRIRAGEPFDAIINGE